MTSTHLSWWNVYATSVVRHGTCGHNLATYRSTSLDLCLNGVAGNFVPARSFDLVLPVVRFIFFRTFGEVWRCLKWVRFTCLRVRPVEIMAGGKWIWSTCVDFLSAESKMLVSCAIYCAWLHIPFPYEFQLASTTTTIYWVNTSRQWWPGDRTIAICQRIICRKHSRVVTFQNTKSIIEGRDTAHGPARPTFALVSDVTYHCSAMWPCRTSIKFFGHNVLGQRW